MTGKFAKIVGLTAVIWALGSIAILGGRAQQSSGNSKASAVTTNWAGFLVAGRGDRSDRITPNPVPTVLRRIEIGLRSDGVVIWREAMKTK